jgi:hypothetical protein
MKGVDRADQYFSYYSVLRKTVEWSNVSPKLCTLQCIFLYKTLNTNKKMNYNNFLHEVARSWVSEVQNPNKSSFDELQWPEKQPTPSGPKQDHAIQTVRGFGKHKLDKVLLVGEA